MRLYVITGHFASLCQLFDQCISIVSIVLFFLSAVLLHTDGQRLCVQAGL